MERLDVITKECMYGYNAYTPQEIQEMDYGRRVLLESRFQAFRNHINKVKTEKINSFFRGLSFQCTKNTGQDKGILYDFLNEPVEYEHIGEEDGVIVDMTLKDWRIDGRNEVRKLVKMGLQ